MGARRPQASASERPVTPAGCIMVGAMLMVAAVGCGSPAPERTAGTGQPTGGTAGMTACGTTRTAANVPVHIEIAHGRVSCATALTVERDYAKAILAGEAPGTGGGGPVRVRGWTCQGFATPVVLKTGQASKCVQSGNEILAVLPAPA